MDHLRAELSKNQSKLILFSKQGSSRLLTCQGELLASMTRLEGIVNQTKGELYHYDLYDLEIH